MWLFAMVGCELLYPARTSTGAAYSGRRVELSMMPTSKGFAVPAYAGTESLVGGLGRRRRLQLFSVVVSDELRLTRAHF